MPESCTTNPSDRTCVLHLWPAFCIDVPEVRYGMDASDALEACAEKISRGPCVANPSGAACASNLFAGVQYDDSRGGSDAGSKRRSPEVSLYSRAFNPLEGKFWKGVMKNVLKKAVGSVKELATPNLQQLRTTCNGVTRITGLFKPGLAEVIRQGCDTAFKSYNSIQEFTYENAAEKTGAIFADVVDLLSLVKDIPEAQKVVGAADQVLKGFKKVATAMGGSKGVMLEAKHGKNAVQIFRNAGDDKPLPLYTNDDVKSMEKSVRFNGFDNCNYCIGSSGTKVQRQLVPGMNILTKLCCFLLPEDDTTPPESPEPEPESEPLRPLPGRKMGSLRVTKGLSADEMSVLTTLSQGYTTAFQYLQPVSVNVDEITSLLIKHRGDDKTWKAIQRASAKVYQIDDSELAALEAWAEHSMIYPEFKTALFKLPPTTGLVIRSINLDPAGFEMLNKLEPGRFSKGPRGIYEVKDLVRNKHLAKESETTMGQVLAATVDLGQRGSTPGSMATRDCILIINSRSSRYIDALAMGSERETIFLQGMAGKFKLLGRQELYGGEAARAAGERGPYGVYYFDEIEVPATTSKISVKDVRNALKKEGIR
ncbi:hypothetical protein LZ30DRAFT_822057 [Colletotrichum cereale]|nr:hypothetical protein LZ30DRAFT_822057 [Colletotrichum cereale]